mmetsp:Transcript_91601/g.182500  ORF Transcript_91601/g.182500 Transcript_91601/m.182500 type:complete len:260 (-) Transcript_91601:237-1016(-)
MAKKDAETQRIFNTEWLHRLQVQYPWFCGYAIAPVMFFFGASYGATSLTVLSRLPPLLVSSSSPSGDAAVSAAALGAKLLFCGHFVRRALEVIYVNDYTGTFVRDSRGELVYYAVWGLMAGTAAGTLPLSTYGVVNSSLRLAGAVLFVIGQIGNYWCHSHLRELRAEKKALGTHKYVIPSAGPFQYVATPHYSFELLSWLGYWIHGGLDVTGAILLLMSVSSMGPFAGARYAKYLELFKEGDRSGGDPSTRWKLVPGLW